MKRSLANISPEYRERLNAAVKSWVSKMWEEEFDEIPSRIHWSVSRKGNPMAFLGEYHGTVFKCKDDKKFFWCFKRLLQKSPEYSSESFREEQDAMDSLANELIECQECELELYRLELMKKKKQRKQNSI